MEQATAAHWQAIRKADVLIEALDYIRQFRDRLTVIKLGGSCMEDPDALRALLLDVVFMETVGLRPVLVHGGGKAINRAMAADGRDARFVHGRRYTDAETLEIVRRVLIDEINATIVRTIEEYGGRAVGLHAQTTNCLWGETLALPGPNGSALDLGLVGVVTRVDTRTLANFARGGVVPVIPSLAQVDGPGSDTDPDGLLNVNADTAAAAVAGQLGSEKLIILTDTPGILRDRDDETSLLGSLTAQDCRDLIARGIIDAGMIPKVEACLESLRAGVKKVHIIDGRLRHSLLLEIFTHTGIGTEIVWTRH